jgi:photosystem II stability/assembly factor-like uncharacterized protein
MNKNTLNQGALLALLLIGQGFGQWVHTGGPTGPITRALAVSDGVIFAGTDDGVFFSSNHGNDWTAANIGLAKDTVVSLAVNAGALLAGTLHKGIFISTNNGGSWTAVNKGLPNNPLDTISYAQINDIAAVGSNLLTCTFSGGVFLSRNSGTSWTAINTGLTNTSVYSLAVNGSDLFAGTGAGGGVFVSSDSGATWRAVNNGLTYTPGMVYSVYELAASNGHLFAGTFAGGVYRTANNGESWTDANNGLLANSVQSLYAHGGNLFAGTGSSGVFLSTDNGASWAAISNGLPSNDAVLCLCVSDSILFAGLYSGGVWRCPLLNTVSAPTNVALEKASGVNVFGISTTSGILRYMLPVASIVSIKYYDLEGRLLISFVDHSQAAGNYSLALPSLPRGFYVRDFRAGSFTQKDRVTILR